ncbi:hypothetical protein N9N67_07965 [Bacteriovoracaceae bacterium]|nr:hypothetical protein [Bacteriovoracaceae bacterium]
MLLYACLKAILVPMYTVVFLVNDWHYAHPFISDYIQWHQFEMIFSFLVSVLIAFEYNFSMPKRKLINNSKWVCLMPLSFILADNILWIGEGANHAFVLIHSLFILFFIKFIPRCPSLKHFLLKRFPLKFLLILKIAVFQSVLQSDTELFNLMIKLGFAGILIFLIGLTWCHQLYRSTHRVFKIHFISSLCLLLIGLIWYGANTFFDTFESYAFGDVHFLFALGVSSVLLNLMIQVGYSISSLPLKIHWAIYFMLGSLFLGGITRSVLPEIYFNYYFKILHFGMGFWTLSFIFYLFYFTPKFLKKDYLI